MAREIGIEEVVQLADVPARVTDFDVVVGAVEGGVYLFGPEQLGGLGGREFHVIDLAMPPCIDPAVAQVPGVTLIDIASLQGVVSTNSERRMGAVPQAEAIIAEGIESFERKVWEESELKPVVLRMGTKINAMLAQIFPNLEAEVLKQGAERLVNMHVRKIKDIRNTEAERRAHLEALRAVYMSLEE